MIITTKTNWNTKKGAYVTTVKAIELSKEDEELGFYLPHGVLCTHNTRGIICVGDVIFNQKSLELVFGRIRDEKRLAAPRRTDNHNHTMKENKMHTYRIADYNNGPFSEEIDTLEEAEIRLEEEIACHAETHKEVRECADAEARAAAENFLCIVDAETGEEI